MLKKIYLHFLFLSLITIIACQNEGLIQTENSSPIEGKQVLLSNGTETKTTVTDPDGIYPSTDIPNGNDTVDSKITRITNSGVPGAYGGYTLICFTRRTAILIDMDGNVIKNWPVYGYPAKILNSKDIMGGYTFLESTPEIIDFVQMDWEGKINWSFSDWDDNGIGSRQHHDFQREGNPVGYYAPTQKFVENGKTLILSYYNEFVPEISEWELLDEVIYEVDWEGNIGFEWHASDHFDDMGFNERAKHGIYNNEAIGGYLHINSMSEVGKNKWYDDGDIRFHPKNIIISSRHGNFMAIISRETGNIVWRVGPNYDSTTEEGRKLGQIIGQHHVHLIPEGLPGAGNILVFDNGGASGWGYFGMPNKVRLYSRVIEFNPITLDVVWEYTHINGSSLLPRTGDNHKFFSIHISSAQRLPNGNTLITEGANSRVFEVNPNDEIVWEYLHGQYLEKIYRAYRIPPEWVKGNPSNYENWE